MITYPTYVLSRLKTGEELTEYLTWIENLRKCETPRARLILKMRDENLPLAILWYDHLMSREPRHGTPILRAYLEGKNTLGGLLIWLASSHARAISRGTVVEGMQAIEYASRLHDALVERISRHILFTSNEAKLYGGNAPYRHVRATILLNTSILLSDAVLRKNFCTIPCE